MSTNRSRVHLTLSRRSRDLAWCLRSRCLSCYLFFFGFAPFFGTIVLAGREWVRSESDSSKLRFWEIWNNPGAQSYRFFFVSVVTFGLKSIPSSRIHYTLSGSSSALGSILRSRAHPALSGPSSALGSILRSRIHPAVRGPLCALGSSLRSRVPFRALNSIPHCRPSSGNLDAQSVLGWSNFWF